MPNFEFTIPQKGGTTVTIPTVDPRSATKSLGVMYDVMNECDHQVQYISDKGTVWTSRLNSDAHISKRDAWKSFFFQLQPSLSYSIVTVSADPKSLAKAQSDIFHDSLSRLGVNQKIDTSIRTLPHRYGGLGMFDLNILCAGAKLHFVRSFWNTFTPEGDHLCQSYETFLMDVGLGGNIFSRNYNTLGFLAEHC